MEKLSSPPPLAPPTSEESRVDWLRLLRSRRVGATTFHRLITTHQTPRAALQALPEIAREAGISDYQTCPIAVAEAEFRRGRACGAEPVFFGAPAYPPALLSLPDAPPLLWAKGNLALGQRPIVALVGARNASSLGQRMARTLAQELGRAGLCIASGLARGIDAQAHRAALPTGTIGVIAGGIDTIYPRENEALYGELAKSGLILTEQPPGLSPQARHFPRRNRIVSGLARGVVVVEAAAKSGSLITARTAAEQGRDVMAVPGHPFDARSAGSNILIRDGATLVRGAGDILEHLGHDSSAQTPLPLPEPAPAAKAPRRAGNVTKRILTLLGAAPVAEDQLARDLALPAARIAQELLTLEMEGQIDRQPGGLVTRQS